MPSSATKGFARALAALLLLALAPGAHAAEAYDWSGTLSVDRTGSGLEAGSHIAFAGPSRRPRGGGSPRSRRR